jgi:hypothetical protein
MNLVKALLSFVMFACSIETFAQRKEIREVDTNDRLMKIVNLTMGRSTVLSFQEKPVKVVSGNSNYFNVEFVGNDLTLQPLAPVETNLFVYTEKGTKFGFLLKVGPSSIYDDILYIKWKSQNEILMKSLKPQKLVQPFKLFIGKEIQINVRRFLRLGEIKTYIFDFEIESIGGEKLKTASIDVFVSRTNQRFIGQKLIFEKEEVKKEEIIRARLLTRIEQAQDFSFIVKVKDKEVKSIITKDYL